MSRRILSAVALSAVAIVTLTACSPASREDQAIEQLNEFIAATNGDGEFNYCEDMGGSSFSSTQPDPSRVSEGEEPRLDVAPNGVADRVDVYVQTSSTDGDDAPSLASLWVRFPEGDGPCVMGGVGFYY